MCKCPQDDDYQTSSECPLNRHYSHDLSHASSMWGERNRRTATRERTNKSSTFSSVSSDQPCDARTCCSIDSVDVPSSGRSTTGRRLLTGLLLMCHITSAHLIPQQRSTVLRTLHHVYETCCCHQLTRSKYSWPFHHRPKIHQSAHLQTCRLPPVGRHLCCSPNTLTRKISKSRYHRPRFHSQLEIRPSLSSSSDRQPRVHPAIGVPTFSAAVQQIVQFHAVEHSNVNVMYSETHILSDHEQFHLRIHQDVHITRSVTMYSPFVPSECISIVLLPFSAQDEIACRQQHPPPGVEPGTFVARSAVLGFCGMLAKSQ